MPADDPDERLDPETEAAVRTVVSEELDRNRRNSPWRAVGQVLAGVLFALFVLQPLLGVSVLGLAEAGVPLELLAVGLLLLCAGLVAYGWRLPPFR